MNNKIYIAGKISGDEDYKTKFKYIEAILKEARVECTTTRIKPNDICRDCSGCPFFDRHYVIACRIYEVFPDNIEVVNPVDFDLEGRPYWVAMLKCLWELSRCKYVYMLRDWRQSRGAQVEHRWALRLKKQIIYQQ